MIACSRTQLYSDVTIRQALHLTGCATEGGPPGNPMASVRASGWWWCVGGVVFPACLDSRNDGLRTV